MRGRVAELIPIRRLNVIVNNLSTQDSNFSKSFGKQKPNFLLFSILFLSTILQLRKNKVSLEKMNEALTLVSKSRKCCEARNH